MSAPLMPFAIILAQMAPMIARWFSKSDQNSSTTAMIAEKVVSIAKAVTGSESAKSAVELLQKNPDMLIKFQHSIMKIDHDMEELFIHDRQDARARDIARMEAGRSNLRADIMVICAAIGLISCLAVLVFHEKNLPGEAVGIISTVAGIFGACLKDAFAFEFGSSRGSKSKDHAVLLGIQK